ncbi:MAG: endo-1,3-1,4-beta-glycanase ExsH, partial [Deltaproteobacteria bacterium]|nr:endo-1,3-1,4-beta-glycanase ExsH [Deltaproteobacteria bacterium]
GGGIESYSGSTDLVGSTVSGNTATFGIGGGIENTDQASLSLTNSAVTGNTAVNQWGGGIANGGWFTLSDSTISGNVADRGGGVSNSGQATLTNNTVSSNSAVGWDGGGILNLETGTLTVVGGTVSDNTAVFGAGIRNWNQAHVTDVTVSNNIATRAGGGVSNRLGGATMTMSGSTVVGNVAQDGASGGIGNSGNITLINTTLSENTSASDGGGMVNYTGGTADLSEMTFSLNSASIYGGGISNRPDANMTLTGITVHGNTAEAEGAGGVANA